MRHVVFPKVGEVTQVVFFDFDSLSFTQQEDDSKTMGHLITKSPTGKSLLGVKDRNSISGTPSNPFIELH